MNLGSNKKLSIRDKLEVASKEDNIRKTLLRWFGHVQSRSVDVSVEKIDFLELTSTSRVGVYWFGLNRHPNQTKPEKIRFVMFGFGMGMWNKTLFISVSV